MKIAFALSLVAATGVASAQVIKKGPAYSFRFKFTKNAPLKYITSVSQLGSSAQTGQINLKIPYSQKVLSVAGNTANVQFSMGPITFNGQAFSQKPTVTTVKMTSDGKIVGGAAAANQGVTVFPTQPIRPGASWKATVPLGGFDPSGNSKANATYKFIGIKNVGGKQAAELAVSMVGSGATKVSGSGKTFISVADGSLLQSDMLLNIASAQLQGTKGPLKLAVKIRKA